MDTLMTTKSSMILLTPIMLKTLKCFIFIVKYKYSTEYYEYLKRFDERVNASIYIVYFSIFVCMKNIVWLDLTRTRDKTSIRERGENIKILLGNYFGSH